MPFPERPRPGPRPTLDFDQVQESQKFLARIREGHLVVKGSLETALYVHLCQMFVNRVPTRGAVRKFLRTNSQLATAGT